MMNEVRSTAQALPDHLRGRDASLWVDDVSILHIIPRGREPMRPEGKIEQWWPVLTPAQQHDVLMASIMIVSKEKGYADVGDVRVFDNAEVSLQITTSQRQEYFDLHPREQP